MKKTAFITGGGGYIGSETALTLASEGIQVAICDIHEAAIEAAVTRVTEAGGIAKGYIGDVTDSASIEATMRQAAADLGGLDILVHVAGGSARIAGKNARYVPLAEQEDWVIDRVLQVNLYGAFWSNRAAARIMLEQGRGGKIVNFASAVGLNGLAGCADYAASKGGVMSLTKALAKELGPHKINVNAVAPGIVMRPEEGNSTDRALKTNVLGEKCTAADIANLVAFLASDKANFITGQTYVCDGGRTLSMKGTD